MERLYKLIGNALTMPPITGTLSNGKTVTAYNRLPKEILIAEGWKPLIVETPPELQEGYKVVMYYEDTQDAIVRKWRTEPIQSIIDEGEAQDEGLNAD